MSPPPSFIFKIMHPEAWAQFRREGQTDGSALDRQDGYIHFSTAAQLPGTLAKHYAGAGELVLAEVPLTALSEQILRWEAARGGALFPHLYGRLDHGAISRHWALHPDADGVYALPDLNGEPQP